MDLVVGVASFAVGVVFAALYKKLKQNGDSESEFLIRLRRSHRQSQPQEDEMIFLSE